MTQHALGFDVGLSGVRAAVVRGVARGDAGSGRSGHRDQKGDGRKDGQAPKHGARA